MCNTEAIIRHCLQEGVKMTLVVNKIDRLILELRIKPADAFYKIKHTIEEVNTFIRFVLPGRDFICHLTDEKLLVESTQTPPFVSAQRTAMSLSRALT